MSFHWLKSNYFKKFNANKNINNVNVLNNKKTYEVNSNICGSDDWLCFFYDSFSSTFDPPSLLFSTSFVIVYDQ